MLRPQTHDGSATIGVAQKYRWRLLGPQHVVMLDGKPGKTVDRYTRTLARHVMLLAINLCCGNPLHVFLNC